MKRTPIKRRRATPRRRDAPRFDREDWDTANAALATRSGGRCERCGDPLNGRVERHHRQRRRDGGDRLSNLLYLCSACHRFITDRPESETGAREQGYIVSALASADPTEVPVLLWGTSWVLLDDEGARTILPR